MPFSNFQTREDLENKRFRELVSRFTLCRQMVDTHEKLSIEVKEKFRKLSMEAQNFILDKAFEASESGLRNYDKRLDENSEIWITRIDEKILELLKLTRVPREKQDNPQRRSMVSAYVVHELVSTFEIGLEMLKKGK